jgi:hypothetical protein
MKQARSKSRMSEKGFEYAKDQYIEIDPNDLKALRLEPATTTRINQFVRAAEYSIANIAQFARVRVTVISRFEGEQKLEQKRSLLQSMRIKPHLSKQHTLASISS